MPAAIMRNSRLSNRFCPSVVVVVCHKILLKISRTGDLEAITTSKQKVKTEIRVIH